MIVRHHKLGSQNMLLTENRFLVVFTFVGIKRSLSMLSLRGNLVPHIFSFLGGRFENFNKTKFVLSLLSSLPPRPATLIVLLALGPHDEPLQFDCIAFRLLNFYTHPPLPEVWLTPELREPFETYSFLVPHSLTLPEYLAQFVCELDYYSLMFYYA